MIFVCSEVVMVVNGKIGVFWYVTPCTYRQMVPLKCPTCIPNYTALDCINFNIIQFVEYPYLFKMIKCHGCVLSFHFCCRLIIKFRNDYCF